MDTSRDRDAGPLLPIPYDELTVTPPPATPRRPRRLVPLVLYAVTCASTWWVGGVAYAAALMTILTAHELGHYLQARRYGVPASWPYFIPMPATPIGTLGAVIAMRPGGADRRALFDLAITGPIAGLVPAIVASWAGLRLSRVVPAPEIGEGTIPLGEPLVFELLSRLTHGPLPEGYDVILHPLAFAGWVGIFITALNLLPLGQLDGGHILYALVPRRAHVVSATLFAAAAVAIVVFGYWQWVLLMLLIGFFGIYHPPTADDRVPLGLGRTVLGWLVLAFLVAGFTPTPFKL